MNDCIDDSQTHWHVGSDHETVRLRGFDSHPLALTHRDNSLRVTTSLNGTAHTLHSVVSFNLNVH